MVNPQAGDQPSSPPIATPDQRLRVFVSAALPELTEERETARAAVSTLRLHPVMVESGARSHSRDEIHRSYLEQSDIFVGIYGSSYELTAPGEDRSSVEAEYLMSGPLPRLIYVKTGIDVDPRLRALLERIRDDGTVSYRTFRESGSLSNSCSTIWPS